MWNDDVARMDAGLSILGLISLSGAAERLDLSDERMEVLAMEGRFGSIQIFSDELVRVISQHEIEALLRDPEALKALRRPPRRPRRCPECSEQRWLRIVYGLPAGDLFDQAERGEVALGGCMVWPDPPTWRCASCGCEWSASGRITLGQRDDEELELH